ncbi:MAG: hypothetical protein FWH00_00430 [Oscillospiraceae bacterium]|nr:hypothetical protein [Oscillospiraceae bacterium]
MQISNQRPGIYSSYSVTSHYAAARSVMSAALVIKLPGFAQGLHTFDSPAEAAEALGSYRTAQNALRILFDSGVSRVYLAAVNSDSDLDYLAAIGHIAELPGVGAVICDAQDEDDLLDLVDSVEASSQAMRERLLFVGIDTAAHAAAAASALNHERGIVCTPAAYIPGDDVPSALYTACAFAGSILAQPNPGHNFSAYALGPLSRVERLPEADVQSLIAKGVCVFEQIAGNVECIRAVTTRTEPDLSMRPLNSILIIDDVMRSLRTGLHSFLRGARTGLYTHESISAQAAIILSQKRDEGILTSFEPPSARTSSEDPSVCIVQITFGVAHIVEQIHLSAHIRV